MVAVPIRPEILVREVLPKYHLSKPTCRFHAQGLNDTYFVTNGSNRYVLRVYRRGWRTRNDIEFELDVLQFLHRGGLPICAPILTHRSSRLAVVHTSNGRRYVAVFEYAHGRPAEHSLLPRQARRLGSTVAKIHTALDEFHSRFQRPELDFEFLLDRPLRLVRSFFPHRTAEMDYLERQCTELKEMIQGLRLSKSAPSYGVCIGDLHGGNAHFTKSDDATLFDFDQCAYGWRAFEIAKFLHASRIRRVSPKSIWEFRVGYMAIRNLREEELAAIPYFVRVALIWSMGIHARAVGILLPKSWMNDRWLKQRLQQLRTYEKADY